MKPLPCQSPAARCSGIVDASLQPLKITSGLWCSPTALFVGTTCAESMRVSFMTILGMNSSPGHVPNEEQSTSNRGHFHLVLSKTPWTMLTAHTTSRHALWAPTPVKKMCPRMLSHLLRGRRTVCAWRWRRSCRVSLSASESSSTPTRARTSSSCLSTCSNWCLSVPWTRRCSLHHTPTSSMAW